MEERDEVQFATSALHLHRLQLCAAIAFPLVLLLIERHEWRSPSARYVGVWGSEGLGARFRTLTSALGEGEWLACGAGCFIPGQNGQCLLSFRLVEGPELLFATLKKRSLTFLCRESIHDSLGVQP